MKKIRDLIKPYISIILGALFLLSYIDYLGSGTGAGIAIGVIAMVVAAYYITIGVLGVVMGDKLQGKIVTGFSVCCFPVFMFVSYLIGVIGGAGLGITDWVILIVSMIGYLAFAIVYVISLAAPSSQLNKLVYLFSSIVVLAMVLDIVYGQNGGTLGNIVLASLIIYILYADLMFASLPSREVKMVAVEDKPEE